MLSNEQIRRLNELDIRDGFDRSKKEVQEAEKVASEIIKKLRDSGNNIADNSATRALIIEYVKSNINPGKITHLTPSDSATELARLVDVLHTHGYNKEGLINREIMEREMNKEIKYNHGTTRTLTERYGTIDYSLSNNDFIVVKKPGERPIVAFRGSRVDPNDPTTKADWAYNFTEQMRPELKKALPNYRRIIENLKKVEDSYGGFKKFTGYSKGGGHAIEFSQMYNAPAEVFNPHIRGDSPINNLKSNVLIHRINEDPASFGLAFGGRSFKPQDIISNPPPP